MAVCLVTGIENKSVKDISKFLREKAGSMARNSGGEEHKQRTQSGKFLPSWFIAFMIKVVKFISSDLGISVPAMGIKKDGFGAACVTSIGAFGFEDAIAPFSGTFSIKFRLHELCFLYVSL